MKSNYKKLGQYIRIVDERNKNLEDLPLMGLSVQKKFFPTIANLIGTDMSTYKIVYKNQFTYIADTSRRGDKIAIALNEKFDKMLVSQAYTPFEIIDVNELLPEYLMMWFRRPEFDRYARFKSHGSAREIFGWEEMCETELPIPTIDKQKEIVKEYHILVDRIELNNKLITKLEETAQAIYKQWFVDFEFPDENGLPYKSNGGVMVESELGEIPVGSTVSNLDNLIEVRYGKDYKHLEKGNIPLYGSGGVMSYVSNFLYDKPTILIPRKGSLNNILFLNKPFWSVDTMFYSILKKEYNGCYVYFFLTSKDFNSLNVGSAVPSMTTNYLNNMRIINPPDNVLKQFDKLVRKLFSNIEFKKEQNEKVYELQNLLLSKLATIEN